MANTGILSGLRMFALYAEALAKLNKQDTEALRKMLKVAADVETAATSTDTVEPARQSRQGDGPVDSDSVQSQPTHQSRQGDGPVEPESVQSQTELAIRLDKVTSESPGVGLDKASVPSTIQIESWIRRTRLDNILSALKAGSRPCLHAACAGCEEELYTHLRALPSTPSAAGAHALRFFSTDHATASAVPPAVSDAPRITTSTNFPSCSIAVR
jgi:hypothetical protein